jgi:hypothetical protein
VGCLLICCGINVMACTVVGAYVAMTLVEVRARPTYIVSEILSMDKADGRYPRSATTAEVRA